MLRHLLAGAITLACAGCSPVAVLNALVPDDTYESTLAIGYGEDSRQKLDVYRPRGAPPPSGFPVVVFFYGGTWSSGERSDYRFVGEALAARGMLTVIADYRLYPKVRYPAFLEDAAQAVAWAHREARRFGGNPDELYVMGHSAGAYNAAMLALDARWLKGAGLSTQNLAGWIGLAGPYDFLPSDDPVVQGAFHHPNYPPGAEPVEHVAPRAPRTLLGVARSDSQVDPERNTARLAGELRQAKVPVTLRRYDRVNHMTLAGALGWPLRWLAPVLEDVVSFVRAP